ncbi:excinuclease ABC subunit A [candidate division WOR-3 bacterium JGI_Cruoil_03_44_89]|uniref:UvrABC system protein A n=1 Tax=candidate division WOR-3 bacterium JGI_Cruoil_03_44_89 TaxID=1973748 RepID=A0A235BVT1_UNCW3|nr:MAG: excinuclease ABC subunit A [candidate division WOR-3 bacterium JGI_Cruoil_03_44_89]
MIPDKILIKGARVHNLKNIDVEMPKNKLVVITGISGSGKSSLAFDTLYAEGQRRYVESLSAYARQFLGIMQKPDVDYIEGLSPAISISQRTASRNPRSTVGTITEIYDYLRLLYARIGIPYCYKCGREITAQTVDQIVDRILQIPDETRFQILSPVVRGRKGEYKELFSRLSKKGYVRVRVDGEIYDISDAPELERYRQHTIEIVVDRLVMFKESHGKEGIRSRLADSVETALSEGDGIVIIEDISKRKDYIFSTKLSCPICGISYEEITPRVFSFNSPYGACPACHGLGTELGIDPELVVGDRSLSILGGAVVPWGKPKRGLLWRLESLSRRYNLPLNTPWEELSEEAKGIILDGTPNFEGVLPRLLRLYMNTESDFIRREIEKYMVVTPCKECGGARLKKESLFVKIRGLNIYELTNLTIEEESKFFKYLKLTDREKSIARLIVREIERRLTFLLDVGLSYLTLSRNADTLSGGEDERVRLATQVGSGLVGVVYILDEPSIGLHQRDNIRLLSTLKRLRDMGNTVVLVEHDRETILQSDYVIDLGPGAGEHGGWVVATGTPEDIKGDEKSITGAYLSGRRKIEIPKKRKNPSDKWLIVRGARHNNLKNIDVRIPLGLFVVVTGVSGSGKSSLIDETLYRALARRFYRSNLATGEHRAIENIQLIDKVVNIDQSPIGRTPRSNPSTYTGLFTYIRELFAALPESKMRGYKPGRFSFNVRGGRCEACDGGGLIKVEMHFLPDIYIPCEVCKGRRYNRETLEVSYRGKNIADVLSMTVSEAMEFFEVIPRIKRKLGFLNDVGLGYIQLGQSATTLSGGEAQRVKLAKELSKIATGNTLYLLDEPTTGLHFEDVRLLLDVLNRLVERGNTVIVIEHNMEVIKCADWIIDLGPEAADEGGYVVAEGPPEKIAKKKKSYTGKYLKQILSNSTK